MRSVVGSLIPMAMEVILPVTSFFITQKMVKSSLDKKTHEKTATQAGNADTLVAVDRAQIDVSAQEDKNSERAMQAGMIAGIGVSSVVTWWLIKSLIKDPHHFKEEPLGRLMEWVKPGSADWLIGNTVESEQRHMGSARHESHHSR